MSSENNPLIAILPAGSSHGNYQTLTTESKIAIMALVVCAIAGSVIVALGAMHMFGHVGSIGFIASVSRPFCRSCNRLRLTADGKLRSCLFAIEEDDVKRLLRDGATDQEIAALIRRNVAGKWAGHEINTSRFVAPPRPMYAIGG